MTDRDTSHEQLRMAVADLSAEFVKMGRVLAKAMSEFMASPSGQYLRAVVDHFDRHPEQLDAMIAARETEARAHTCHCLCQRWNHLGVCAGEATTERTFVTTFGPTTVPLCVPCSTSIDRQQVALTSS